jgi:hypothetical protein
MANTNNTSLVHVQMPDKAKELLKKLVEALTLQPDRTLEVNEAYHEAKGYLADEKAHV